jgi:hypothetical protein
MPRTKIICIGFLAATTLTGLLTRIAPAEDAVEARAERVCARIGKTDTSFQGTFNVDNLNFQRDAKGTVTLERDGVKLGEIAESSYADHTVCLVEVMALISSDEIEAQAAHPASQRPRRRAGEARE